MGILLELKHSKCAQTRKELNRYIKFCVRFAETEASIEFHRLCIETRDYPKSFWKALRRQHIRPSAATLKRHALNLIESDKTRLEETKRLVAQTEAALDNLRDEERIRFLTYVRGVTSKQVDKKRCKMQKNLSETKGQTRFPSVPEQYVHNLSSVHLDRLQLQALSLGLKFSHPQNKYNRVEIETQFEHLFKQTNDLVANSDMELEQFKSTLVNVSFQYQRQPIEHHRLLTKAHLDALRELQKNEDLIITKPDKGSGTVLMDRADYIKKMKMILSDTSRFVRCEQQKDKTECVENQLIKCLKSLVNDGAITKETYDRLRPIGTITPRLYGLPKIHKPDTPLRPILDMRNSPYHNIAQWLTKMLNPIRQMIAPHRLADTFQFINEIRDMNVQEHRMFSLDVVSLFTNVPLIETVNYLCSYIDQHGINIGIGSNQLKELILRCTYNVQFQFNSEFYRQVDGVAMGSPLGPLLADIYMGMLENGPLKQVISGLKFYRRYVDDIICISDWTTKPQDIIDCFNNAHPNAAFTAEEENNNQMNFLDASLIRRTDGSIQRKVYRKPYWTGQYMNFHSFAPLSQKRTLVRTLTDRAYKICSEDTIKAELARIKEALLENGYPERFIETHMKRCIPKVSKQTVEKKQLYLTLPFKGNSAAETCTRRLQQSCKKTFNAAQLNVIFTSKPLLVPRFKDRVPDHLQSMLIYRFTCPCGARYVGRTTRHLGKRIKEHLPGWLYTRENRTNYSAITNHLINTGHQIDKRTAFQILYKIPSRQNHRLRASILATAEAICIRLTNPNLCVQKKLIQTLQLPWPTTSREGSNGTPQIHLTSVT
ncbi:unnamed protein product [Dicrocoelium dendriticum]|nr:unnamed protein product [Dicrocoelium dendriticum]